MSADRVSFESDPAFVATVPDAQRWEPYAREALERHGLHGPRLTPVSTRETPIFRAGSDIFVKIYGPWVDGYGKAQREVGALRTAGADHRIGSPRLLGSGEFDDVLRYVIMDLVRGTSLRHARASLSTETMIDTARWLGLTMQRLRALDVEAHMATRRSHYPERVERLHARAAEDILAHGRLPRHLATQVADWLPPVDALLPEGWPGVFLHNDLQAKHVFGERHGDRFHPVGIIDFNKALVGHPYAELPVLWRDFRHEEPIVQRTVLEAAYPENWADADFPRLALAWSLMGRVDIHYGDLSELDEVRDLDALAAQWFDLRTAPSR